MAEPRQDRDGRRSDRQGRLRGQARKAPAPAARPAGPPSAHRWPGPDRHRWLGRRRQGRPDRANGQQAGAEIGPCLAHRRADRPRSRAAITCGASGTACRRRATGRSSTAPGTAACWSSAIEGFCGKDAWKRAYREINEFERQLADDGVRIVKILVHVSAEEQKRRMIARLDDPHKHYKIGLEDFRNIAKRKAYIEAYDDMLERTDTEQAPWHVIASRQQDACPSEGPEDRPGHRRQGHRRPSYNRSIPRSPKRPTSCGAGSLAPRRRTSTTDGVQRSADLQVRS